MYISHKSSVLQTVHETEWQCRRLVKDQSKGEYWAWLASITTQDDDGRDVITYPSEDFIIVECTDEDVQARLNQLGDYQAEGVYNITWSDSKVSAVTGQDMEGNDITIQTHFSGDDTAKDARLLADEWTRIRRERDRLLSETDWTQNGDSPCTAIDKSQWKTYRQELRDIPKEQSSAKTYEDITWPSSESI